MFSIPTLQPTIQPSPFSSNWKYRQYMTRHAKDVMKCNSMEAIQASGNNPYTFVGTGPVEPQQSDLKFSFWQAQDRKARMFSPVVPHFN